ncbi:MAG: patatin-like phospholipase family protein [Candidatus Omnitrophota bacterium]
MGLFEKEEKIALALGGGAARGLANIGVLKVLKKEKIPVDLLIGSSIGGLIAAAYALGVPIADIEKSALKFTFKKIADFHLSNKSIFRGRKLEAIVEEFIGNKNFADTWIPLAITTTDIETGEELVHTRGNLQKIIRASCSWPGIFPPVTIKGRKLADGGIRNSIPVKMAKHLGAKKIIAVAIGFAVKKGRVDNLFQMFIQSIQILGEELDTYQSMQADVIIKPKLHDIDQFGFHHAKRAIKDGEEAAKKAIPEIRKKLKLGRGLWRR